MAERCPTCGQLLPPRRSITISSAGDLVAALERPVIAGRGPPRARDVYEGADASGTHGSGEYFITYGGERVARAAIDEALSRGLIRREFEIDGAWTLADG